MPIDRYVLKDFSIRRPKHEVSQEDTLNWLAAVHARAEQTARKLSDTDAAHFADTFRKTLWRVACKPGMIAKRGCEVADITHQNWDDMLVYPVTQSAAGQSLANRQRLHAQIAEDVFQSFYPMAAEPPEHIIHVSCTGYKSPSGAQLLVSSRNWKNSAVTHAYHMGCYASIPAIRMVNGPTDIVHTEVCTLHNQPLRHEPEQLVAQSLFADGFIKYSVHPESRVNTSASYLRILGLHEQVIPGTHSAMEWIMEDHGFRMTLVPEIPRYLKNALSSFLEVLCDRARIPLASALSTGIFAIHPGGPRILQSIKDLLNLSEPQLATSYAVLRDYGNMSSATLPHIWSHLLDDPAVPSGTKIISVAFGPGLTIAGAILEKVIPCG